MMNFHHGWRLGKMVHLVFILGLVEAPKYFSDLVSIYINIVSTERKRRRERREGYKFWYTVSTFLSITIANNAEYFDCLNAKYTFWREIEPWGSLLYFMKIWPLREPSVFGENVHWGSLLYFMRIWPTEGDFCISPEFDLWGSLLYFMRIWPTKGAFCISPEFEHCRSHISQLSPSPSTYCLHQQRWEVTLWAEQRIIKHKNIIPHVQCVHLWSLRRHIGQWNCWMEIKYINWE